jgi:hypothetical protein
MGFKCVITYDTLNKATYLSLTGAAKLDNFGPDPPAKPLPRAEPNTLPLPSPPNPEVVAPPNPPPNPNPEAGLFSDVPRPVVVIVDVVVDDFAPKAPNPDVLTLPLKTLGFDAPMVPNGEAL